MRRFTLGMLFNMGCSLLLMAGIAIAAAPGITAALDAWQGPKEAVLVMNGGSAPLISGEMLPWLEVLLARGFAVRTDAGAQTSFEGVILEIQTSGEGSLVILRRGNDGAILALEKALGGAAATKKEAVGPATPLLNPAPVPAVQPTPPLLLEMKPRSLAWLGSEGDRTRVALLAKNGVTVLTLSPGRMEKGDTVPAPGSGWRPLFLSRMGINGGPGVLLAAVWAEDIQSIYEGTDSRIWSQILRWEGGVLRPAGAPIAGYVRFWDGRGAAQQRGAFSLYDGPVSPFSVLGEAGAQGGPLPWGRRGLFELTPLDDDHGLAWTAPGRLAMVKTLDGERTPGGALLEDFGAYVGAEVAVRLEEPGYRSGFGKEDRVLETYHSLPPRMVTTGGSAVTIRRGRREGMMLIGTPQGDDALVRVDTLKPGLRVKKSFAPVSMFIIDFALIEDGGRSAALLLLNERADGRGEAYLQLQREGL